MLLQLKVLLSFEFVFEFVTSALSRSNLNVALRKKICKTCKTTLKSSDGSLKLKSLSTCRWEFCASINTNDGVLSRLNHSNHNV